MPKEWKNYYLGVPVPPAEVHKCAVCNKEMPEDKKMVCSIECKNKTFYTGPREYFEI